MPGHESARIEADPAPAGRPLVLGHRGASISHRENSLDALSAAAAVGADGVEIDVRRSADDVLVLHHDARLDDGRLIRSLTAEALSPEVPTLVEAFEATEGLFLDIEIKNSPTDPDYDAEHGISLAVAGLVNAFDAGHRSLISSFDIDSVLRIGEVDPDLALAWLTFGQADPASLIARAEAHGLRAISPKDNLVDAGFVRRAHDAGLQVFVWTVDDPDRARELAAIGADGIITNDPATIVAALAH